MPKKQFKKKKFFPLHKQCCEWTDLSGISMSKWVTFQKGPSESQCFQIIMTVAMYSILWKNMKSQNSSDFADRSSMSSFLLAVIIITSFSIIVHLHTAEWAARQRFVQFCMPFGPSKKTFKNWPAGRKRLENGSNDADEDMMSCYAQIEPRSSSLHYKRLLSLTCY